jgi:uncharacterized repeat protein (TIGR01451 family)
VNVLARNLAGKGTWILVTAVAAFSALVLPATAGADADMKSTITDAPDPVPTGGILTYTADAENLGTGPATGVTLTVTLPASVFFVSATPSQGSCSHLSGVVTCNLGGLSSGSTESATIAVEPQTVATITANANVTATETDPASGNNASSTSTTVTPGGHVRPKGAATVRSSLVPAYRICEPDQANLIHGPPMGSPSCSNPSPTTSYLTLGAPDVNGQPAKSEGRVRLTRIGETPIIFGNGDQADAGYELVLTDVRNLSDVSDYTGELQAKTVLRISDRDNSVSGNAAATMVDTEIDFTVPCTSTADPTVGGTCSVSTTAEALTPGMVKEGKRTIWAVGKVRVFDGGADGDAQTGPNTLFATQGVFVP